MTYPLLKFIHVHGLILMGARSIEVWYADLRSRQVLDLPLLAPARTRHSGSNLTLVRGTVLQGASVLVIEDESHTLLGSCSC